MNKAMEEMKFDLIHEGLKVKYVPTHDSLKDCRELGILMARKVKEALD